MAGVAVAALVVTACGGEPNRIDDAGDRPQAIARTEETTTTTSAKDERQQVIDAYLAVQPAFIEAALVPDPDYPLEEVMTGRHLEGTRELLEDMAKRNTPLVAPENPEVREVVTSVRFQNDDEDFADVTAREVALLRVCTVDFYSPADAETGEIVGDFSVMTVWSKAAMVKEDGEWKLAKWLTDEPILDVDECPGNGS